uniref:hypothetical protein n=1 Tax=Lactococcus lactis TaxID=1358 RepID=UPI0035CC67F8
MVANDSITVSNVNDGTITHTVWSYSADGTDRFTNVYPNLNLLDGTSFKTRINDNHYMTMPVPTAGGYLGNNYISVNYTNGTPGTATDWNRYYVYQSTTPTFQYVTNGNTYTFSIWARGTGTSQIYAYNNWTAVGNPSTSMTLTSSWQLYKLTVTSQNIQSGSQFFIRTPAGSSVDICLPKLEQGSTATPWMPSASEVTTADWPSYIGQYTDFTQADSTNPSEYTWSLIRGNDGKDGANGKDGIAGKDGKGIKATAITYQASTNGTTAPTGTWSASVPTVAKGSFLWTRTIWTYTDNTTETGYAVAYMGTNGNNGTNGIAGKDGTGIKTTTITYAGSTSGTTAPTSGWTSTVPTVAAGSYLWTKTLWTYTDNSFETGYSVAKMGNTGPAGPSGSNGDPGTSAINIDLSNKSYNFLANLEVSDSGSVMQAVTGSTTTTFTALQGTAAINITALTCTTTLPTGMTVSIGTLNELSVVVTISVDDTMIMPNGVLNFSITAGGVTTTKSFSYSLAINDLTVINLAAINSNLGNVKNIYSNYNGSDGGTYSGTIEINDENIKITATNDNDSNEVSKTQVNGENGIWHSTKLQKTNSPGVYILSNWSLTGTTLSFESQQSDLTYPNGYYYASYGIDMHARNIVGDSISQTTDVDWTSIGTYTKYKRQGNRITLSVVDAMVTTAGNITLGTLPAKDAPYNSIMLTAIAFATTNTNDKHIQINGTYGSGGGLITILGAAANQKYTFQQTFELT